MIQALRASPTFARYSAKGVLKYHRTLATTLNTLLRAGFTMRQVIEFAPTREQIKEMPELAEELERPMMLLVSARKNGA